MVVGENGPIINAKGKREDFASLESRKHWPQVVVCHKEPSLNYLCLPVLYQDVPF